ncbi:MAG: energy-coupled thiamine transporter ThiT [Clostridia bacterium]
MMQFLTISYDSLSSVAAYVFLGLILCIVVVATIIKLKRPDSLNAFGKLTTGIVIGYTIGSLGLLLYASLSEYIEQGYIETATFIPVMVLLGVIVLLAICAFFISIFAPQRLKLFSIISLSVVGVCVTALLVIKLILTYKDNPVVSVSGEIMLYVFTVLIIATIITLALVFGKRIKGGTKSIVYASICIALSFALSYLKLFEGPKGGSVTLASLLPLMLFSYMFGIRKGVIAGAIYGILQFIQGPWFIHPVQFLLDYPIAFSAIGLAGLLKERNILSNHRIIQFSLSATFAVIIRYFCHVISGIFVFGSGDPENFGAVAWSFLYNSFAFVDLAILLVAGIAVFASTPLVNMISSVNLEQESLID